MLSYKLLDDVNYTNNVSVNKLTKTYTFDYPCNTSFDCTDYVIKFNPGVYKFELYGASGGGEEGRISRYIDENGTCISDDIVKLHNGNAKCLYVGNRGGAGGYISGIIKLSNPITAFATIGGHGTFGYKGNNSLFDFDTKDMIKGGYGGGGYAFNFYSMPKHYGSGSGGGQTAAKFLQNDLWHRVIVSGAGGGSDNVNVPDNYNKTDDGSGGSGGGFIGQGYWLNGTLNSLRLANSTFGFTFGSGESAQEEGSKNLNGVSPGFGYSDRAGAGSGWFGGFASHNGNSGSGGGSSWALCANAIIPQGSIPAKGSFWMENESHPYSFSLNDGYIFSDVKTFPGIWDGNGRLVITILDSIVYPSCMCNHYLHYSYSLFLVFFLM